MTIALPRGKGGMRNYQNSRVSFFLQLPYRTDSFRNNCFFCPYLSRFLPHRAIGISSTVFHCCESLQFACPALHQAETSTLRNFCPKKDSWLYFRHARRRHGSLAYPDGSIHFNSGGAGEVVFLPWEPSGVAKPSLMTTCRPQQGQTREWNASHN